MNHLNIEIKARCSSQKEIRRILKERNADFKGLDHQIDTYFKVAKGRLKLREGNIENYLIHYEREDVSGPKKSKVILYDFDHDPALQEILTKTLGVLAVVDKKREIYFVDNVKFHLDDVRGLGKFVEIEAIGTDKNKRELLRQCTYYQNLFRIKKEDLVSCSYSDLITKSF